MDKQEIQAELSRQTKTLVDKDYHGQAHLSTEEFKNLLRPLGHELERISLSEVDMERGYVPFVVVVKSGLVPTEKAMSLANKDGKGGVTKLYPHTPVNFNSVDSVHVPASNVYLILNVDRGKETLNVPPNEALQVITEQGRSPLTIDEGVAIITQYPDFLIKNNCFSLLASRHKGDKRVPAIWINAKKQPNLGWCWDGNPHTWLGSASCSARIGLN